MIRFQIPWARKQVFDSDLGERTGGSAPVPPPPPPTKGPVSGWEGFSADLGHCSFWVIGRPTWNWKGEASRAAHSSYPGAGTGRLERRMGLPPVEVSEQQMGGLQGKG